MSEEIFTNEQFKGLIKYLNENLPIIPFTNSESGEFIDIGDARIYVCSSSIELLDINFNGADSKPKFLPSLIRDVMLTMKQKTEIFNLLTGKNAMNTDTPIEKEIEDKEQVALSVTLGTVLDINEKLSNLKLEVDKERNTSKDDVYKKGLHSIRHQRDQILVVMSELSKDKDKIDIMEQKLDEAYKNGKLVSMQDVKELVNEVKNG